MTKAFKAQTVVLCLLLVWSRAKALAYEVEAKVYFNAQVCRSAHALSDSECLQAYANAKAEFDEKAPRFVTRGECERHFQRCMIGDVVDGRHQVRFMPTMRGFRLDSGRLRRVLPVAYGGEADPLFHPRAVNRVDSFVSGAQTADAQKTWQALISAPASTGGPDRTRSAVDDKGEDPATGSSQSYPLSDSMLQGLKDRERAFGQTPKP